MAAAKYSFVIEQGATLDFQIDWTDNSGSAIDLAGYSARMQIRPQVQSDEVYISLTSDLQPDKTGINLRGANGLLPFTSGAIGVYISAYSSSLLNFDKAVYDLELVSGDYVTRLMEGYVNLSKNVTR